MNNQQGLSDEMLEQLLSPLGVTVEHRWNTTTVEHTYHERLSWRFHLRLSELLNKKSFHTWKRKLLDNVTEQHRNNDGTSNHELIDQWKHLIEDDDITGLRRAMTDSGPNGIRMREMTPFVGILPESDRMQILSTERR